MNHWSGVEAMLCWHVCFQLFTCPCYRTCLPQLCITEWALELGRPGGTWRLDAGSGRVRLGRGVGEATGPPYSLSSWPWLASSWTGQSSSALAQSSWERDGSWPRPLWLVFRYTSDSKLTSLWQHWCVQKLSGFSACTYSPSKPFFKLLDLKWSILFG